MKRSINRLVGIAALTLLGSSIAACDMLGGLLGGSSYSVATIEQPDGKTLIYATSRPELGYSITPSNPKVATKPQEMVYGLFPSDN